MAFDLPHIGALAAKRGGADALAERIVALVGGARQSGGADALAAEEKGVLLRAAAHAAQETHRDKVATRRAACEEARASDWAWTCQ